MVREACDRSAKRSSFCSGHRAAPAQKARSLSVFLWRTHLREVGPVSPNTHTRKALAYRVLQQRAFTCKWWRGRLRQHLAFGYRHLHCQPAWAPSLAHWHILRELTRGRCSFFVFGCWWWFLVHLDCTTTGSITSKWISCGFQCISMTNCRAAVPVPIRRCSKEVRAHHIRDPIHAHLSGRQDINIISLCRFVKFPWTVVFL